MTPPNPNNVLALKPGEYDREMLEQTSSKNLDHISYTWRCNRELITLYWTTYNQKLYRTNLTRKEQKVELILGEMRLKDIQAMKDVPRPIPNRIRISMPLHQQAQALMVAKTQTIFENFDADFVEENIGRFFRKRDMGLLEHIPFYEAHVSDGIEMGPPITIIAAFFYIPVISCFPCIVFWDYFNETRFVEMIERNAATYSTGFLPGGYFLQAFLTEEKIPVTRILFRQLMASYKDFKGGKGFVISLFLDPVRRDLMKHVARYSGLDKYLPVDRGILDYAIGEEANRQVGDHLFAINSLGLPISNASASRDHDQPRAGGPSGALVSEGLCCLVEFNVAKSQDTRGLIESEPGL